MKSLYYLCLNSKKAVTLVEILLACVLMAGAFLPIMGVMTSSIKVTEQDENTQRAVRLCQDKLNMALQMPYKKMLLKKYTNETIKSSETGADKIELKLGEEIIEGIKYVSELDVQLEPVNFTVPTCNFELKGKDTERAEKAVSPSEKKLRPSNWGNWELVTYRVTDKVKRYTVTVKWADTNRSKSASQKFYTLSSLKADIRKN
ncbi:MAG: hypothetical protein II567_05825 [Candidatus Riflebacteria bacterium]|nr:hypothetical protein [Candidatus Riflebacteria bacterium]